MAQIISDISRLNLSEWDSFVERHPRGTVFQLSGMMEVYSATHGNEPLALCAMKDGCIIGVLLASIMTNGKGPIRLLTKRSIIIGGPLVENDDPVITQQLMQVYNRIMRRKGVIYSQIRPVYDSDVLTNQLQPLGYQRVGHYNLTLNLDVAEETMFGNLHKERKRNIAQAEKAGLMFQEVSSENDVNEITSLIEQTYKRKGVPMGYADIFLTARTHLPGVVRFFGAYLDGKMIAGQVRLCYKDLVYAWFAGSDEAYLKKRPNDYLLWHVILWSHRNNYKLFDFGGGGEPGVPYGVRDYKLKFGCDIADYGRLEKHHRPISYWAGAMAYKLYHRIKGK